MFHVTDVLHLEKEEAVLGVFRKHAFTLVPALALATACIVVPFFFLFPLFRSGALGIGVFCVSVLIGIAVAMRAMFLWDAQTLVVSDRRFVLVQQESLFSRAVTEVPFVHVRDVSWDRRGIWEQIFRTGSVRVRTTTQELPLILKALPHPDQVAELLRPVLVASPVPSPVTPVDKMVHAASGDLRRQKLDQIMNLLGRSSDEELDRFVMILEAREKERNES